MSDRWTPLAELCALADFSSGTRTCDFTADSKALHAFREAATPAVVLDLIQAARRPEGASWARLALAIDERDKAREGTSKAIAAELLARQRADELREVLKIQQHHRVKALRLLERVAVGMRGVANPRGQELLREIQAVLDEGQVILAHPLEEPTGLGAELLQARADAQIDGRAMRTLLALPEDANAQAIVDALMGVVSEANLWRAFCEERRTS